MFEESEGTSVYILVTGLTWQVIPDEISKAESMSKPLQHWHEGLEQLNI